MSRLRISGRIASGWQPSEAGDLLTKTFAVNVEAGVHDFPAIRTDNDGPIQLICGLDLGDLIPPDSGRTAVPAPHADSGRRIYHDFAGKPERDEQKNAEQDGGEAQIGFLQKQSDGEASNQQHGERKDDFSSKRDAVNRPAAFLFCLALSGKKVQQAQEKHHLGANSVDFLTFLKQFSSFGVLAC